MAAPAYVNGFAPENRMVSAGGGYDKYGRYDWLMTPGQYAKHNRLMQICKERTGHVPDLTPGYSAYRPYRMQVIYRNDLGIGAAVPGSSSHGGNWAGPITNWQKVPTMAMDYHNWYLVFNNNQSAWFQAVRDAGLVPGQITKAAFGAEEPWHVIDLDPWREVTASDGSIPFPEEDMPITEAEYKKIVSDIFNTPVAKAPNGVDITLAQFMNQTWYLQNQIYDETPGRTWITTLEHPVSREAVQAGDFLRFEPVEHANTRAEVAKVTTPSIDYDKLADLVASKIVIPEGSDVVIDYDEIAKAVRAEFKSDPLT